MIAAWGRTHRRLKRNSFVLKPPCVKKDTMSSREEEEIKMKGEALGCANFQGRRFGLKHGRPAPNKEKTMTKKKEE